MSEGSLRCHAKPNLHAKIIDFRRDLLGYCSRIDPAFTRRFDIGIDPIDKIEGCLAPFLRSPTKFGSLTAALPKKEAFMLLSLRNASISARNFSDCCVAIDHTHRFAFKGDYLTSVGRSPNLSAVWWQLALS
jgi:hypothetical protein